MSPILAWLAPTIGEITIEKAIEAGIDLFKLLGNAKTEAELTPAQKYNKYVVEKFCEKEDSDLVSKEALSQESVYIEAYSKEHQNVRILDSIDQWSQKGKSGVMLIHGEPGHGKTTLCRKAVCEFYRNRFGEKKTNVFWFRLNPAYSDIIKNGELVLENAFCWGNIKTQRKMISLDENEDAYRGSIIFLDGYDELKVQAQSINIRLRDFIDTVKKYAEEYQIHFVITARTRSIVDDLLGLRVSTLQFAPMTEKQQRHWIHERAGLHEYEEKFVKLRNSSEEMKEMLGIPILFRMVVEAELEDTATGVVELYNKLFQVTMKRRDSNSETVEKWHQNYQDLAYEIYCNDEQFADIQGEQQTDEFLYMFYIKGESKQHVEFLHRSFYQYFLAHFLYRKMSEVEDEASAEAFLCCLAERRIDDEILAYVQQVKTSEICRKHVRLKNCKYILDIVGRTDAVLENAIGKFVENIESIVEEWDPMEEIKYYIIKHYPILCDSSSSIREVKMGLNYKKGTPIEQHRYLRCENIFVNAINICYVLTKISLQNNENILRLLRSYDCSGINLADTNLEGAHLEKAKLSFAKLNNIQLNGAYLSRANMDGAKLEGAGLNGADLSGIDLNGANLFNAKLRNADLRNADLRNTDLRRAKLSYADLRRVDLRGAKLTGADVEQAKIRRIDLKGIRLKGVLNLDKVNWQ